MGTPLNGLQINNTYPGLLKTTDNAALGATEKVMGDGSGNDSTLSLGTASASFTGTLDLSNATVTGLPGGAPGLVSGTGSADSLKVADSLLTVNATASGTNSIAIGKATEALGTSSKALGVDTHAEALGSTAIGWGTYAQSNYGIAIGYLNRVATSSDNGISIGNSAMSRAADAITIGRNAIVDDSVRVDTVVVGRGAKSAQYSTAVGAGAQAVGANCVAIGNIANSTNNYAVAIGEDARGSGQECVAIGRSAAFLGPSTQRFVSIGTYSGFAAGTASVSLGYYATAKATDAIAIGNDARVDTSAHTGAVCIGEDTRSGAVGTVSLGRNVTATAWEDSVSVNQFVIQNYASLNFADDTAAATGGVPLGGVYHNSGALRIRIA